MSVPMEDKPLMICHVEKALNYTLYDCKWIPGSAKFVVLGARPNGSGVIQAYQVVTSDVKLVKTIEVPASLKCGTFGASASQKKELAIGDFNGNLQIWDLETSKKIYDVKAHDEIINSIDALGGGKNANAYGPPEICTGSRDGSVKLWDTRQQHKPVAIFESAEAEVKRDCWAVTLGNSYNTEERVLGAGYDNGDLKLFDLRSMKLLWEKNVKNGVCCMQFDRKDIEMNKLLVTTLESKFHVFDCRVRHPRKGFGGLTEKAHKSTIWIGKHLPQNRELFMTAGGNGSLNLWQYAYPEKREKEDSDGNLISVPGTLNLLQNMTLSTQPLSSFDWCPDKIGLAVTTSFDQCLRLIIVTKLNRF